MTDPDIQCPFPANEAQRLRAVRSYGILDTLPEVDFDTLTRVAANAFNTPAAVIGLMDSDRLWFKSRLGLEVPQLDRQIAFCAHAIMLPGEPLVVEDLREDDRFKQNPLVTQAPHLCFYAGAPLVDRHGYALGTIAVVDTKPHEFTEAQRALLCDLSSMVITALESRNLMNQLGLLAMTDHLTGLPNRVQFERVLNSEVAHALRTGEPFTVLYMDLDDFKGINDSFGHAAGDEVLCEVAGRMKNQLRIEDLLARLGGDEFAVIMRKTDESSPEFLVRRIFDAVSAPISLSNGDKVGVGISIGIATYADAIGSMTDLLARADQALYEDKRRKNSP
ncbi:putative diguanylate cyclase YegE [mine drainage metagenome]|uniref:Putative diguanylate cyclase YegE n=1 Tax=mine drainage metagenome TaxID=410659 RepID=A0A1J5QUS3_9ZZZZ